MNLWKSCLSGVLAIDMCLASTGALGQDLKLEDILKKEEAKPLLPLSLVHRFTISDDYEQLGMQRDTSIFENYRYQNRGELPEYGLYKFYSSENKDRIKANWRKISFSMLNKKDHKLSINFRPGKKFIMLKMTFKDLWK